MWLPRRRKYTTVVPGCRRKIERFGRSIVIKENQKRLNHLAVFLDAVVIIASYIAAYWLVFQVKLFGDTAGYSFQQYLTGLYFLVPALLCVYWVLRKIMSPKVFITKNNASMTREKSFSASLPKNRISANTNSTIRLA